LGYAVAASAAVPGLFDPLNMNHLHKEQKTMLADGGVHDNQGLSGLIGEDCTILLVSDASGQLSSQKELSHGRVGVIQRTNDVLQERIRGVEYREVTARLRARAIRSLMFVHLTKDLDRSTVGWNGRVPVAEPPDVKAEPRDQDRTYYNVLRSVQLALARLRTDLDAFTDDEAHALMLSGYRMTLREFERCIPDYPAPAHEKIEDWRFMRLMEVMAKRGESDARPLLASLEGGDAVTGRLTRLFPRVWERILWPLRMVASEVCIASALGAALLWRWPGPGVTVVVGGAIGIALIVSVALWTRAVMRRGKSLSQILLCTLLRWGGCAAIASLVRDFNPLYLAAGRENPVAFDPSAPITILRKRIRFAMFALAVLIALLGTLLGWSLRGVLHSA
jgi:hypothetical protein